MILICKKGMNSMKIFGLKPIFSALLVSQIAFLSLAEPVSLGASRDWEPIRDAENSTCYMVTFPKSMSMGSNSRNAYLSVIVNKQKNVLGQISFAADYNFMPNSTAQFNVDGKIYNMKPRGQNAWLENANQDQSALNAMISGRNLTIIGTAEDGTSVSDAFSLSGVTASWNKIKDCS